MTAKSAKGAIDLAALFGGQIGARIMGFLAFAWLARALSPESYGIVESVVGMALIAFTAIEFGTGTVGMRRVAGENQADANVASAITSARVLLALVWLPSLAAIYILLLGDDVVVLVALFALSLLPLVIRHEWLFLAHEQMPKGSIVNTVKMTAFVALLFVLNPTSASLTLIGLAEVGAMLIALSYVLIAGRDSWSRRAFTFDAAAGFGALKESAALGTSLVLTAVARSFPVAITAVMAGPIEGGKIGAAQRIVISLITFALVYQHKLLPVLAHRYRSAPQEAQRLVVASERFTAWASITGAVAFALAAEPLMGLTFGPNFLDAGLELAIAIWAVPLAFALYGTRSVLFVQEYHRPIRDAAILGTVVTLAVATLLSGSLGGAGAAIGTVCGQLLAWVILLWRGRHAAIRSQWSVWLLPLVVTGAAAAAASAMTDDPWLRAAIAIACMAVVGLADSRLRSAVVVMIRLQK